MTRRGVTLPVLGQARSSGVETYPARADRWPTKVPLLALLGPGGSLFGDALGHALRALGVATAVVRAVAPSSDEPPALAGVADDDHESAAFWLSADERAARWYRPRLTAWVGPRPAVTGDHDRYALYTQAELRLPRARPRVAGYLAERLRNLGPVG